MQAVQILVGRIQKLLVVFFPGQLQNLFDIGDPVIKIVDGMDYGFECGTFFTQCLRIVRFFPDRGFTQLQFNLGKSITLYFVVKDTP